MRIVFFLLVLAASTFGASLPSDTEIPSLLVDIEKEIHQVENEAAELERKIRDEKQSDESTQEEDAEESLPNEEPSKERSKKSPVNGATVCVEVKPSDPYQKPYTVCHPSPNRGYGSPGGVYVGPPAANYGYAPHPAYGPPQGSAYGPAPHGGNGFGHVSGGGHSQSSQHASRGYGSPVPASASYISAGSSGYGAPALPSASYSSAASSGYGAPALPSASYSSAASSSYGVPAPASSGYSSSASSSYGVPAPSNYGSHASSGYGAPSAAYGSPQVIHSSGVSHGSAFGGHNALPSVHPSSHSGPHYRSRELDGDVDSADAGMMGEDDEETQGSSLRMAYNPPISSYYQSAGPSYIQRAPAYSRPGYGQYSPVPAPQHLQYSPLGLNQEMSSCGVPLMLSCQPKIFQGHAIHSSYGSHYGPSYPGSSYGHGPVPVSHVTVQPAPGYGGSSYGGSGYGGSGYGGSGYGGSSYGGSLGHGQYVPAPSHGGYVPYHGSYDIAVGAAPSPQLREVEQVKPSSKHNHHHLHTENKDTMSSQSQVHQTVAASGDRQSSSAPALKQSQQSSPGSVPAARQNPGSMPSTPSFIQREEQDGRTLSMDNQQPQNN